MSDTPENQQAIAAILKRMLTKRAGPKNQLRSEELSQVVPSDQRDKTKEILKQEAATPESPIQTYADRDVYTLASLEEAADRYEELTGERFDYRSTEHTIESATETTTGTLEVEWNQLEPVKQTVSDLDEVVNYDVQYDTHPPQLTITVHEDEQETLRTALRDATDGNVP